MRERAQILAASLALTAPATKTGGGYGWGLMQP